MANYITPLCGVINRFAAYYQLYMMPIILLSLEVSVISPQMSYIA